MNEPYLEKLPGIRDIIDDTEGGAIVLPRESVLVLKGAVEVTPTARGIELTFLGGEGGPSGSGDVVGPASSTANRLAVFADASGKTLADSGVLLGNLIRATGNIPFSGDQSMGGKALTSVKRLTYVLYDGYGNSGAAKTIVAANGDLQRLLVTANCTLSFTLGAEPCSFTLIYEQSGGGGYTLTHPVGTVVIGAIASTGKTVANYLWDGTTLRVGFVGSAAGSGDWLADGSVVATGDFDLGGNKVTDLGDATNPDEATNLGQVQALIAAATGASASGFTQTFDSSTTDADPGDEEFRLNHATPASATAIYLDDMASDATNVRDLIANWGGGAGAIRGYLTLRDLSAPENWIVYSVGGYTSATGYGKLTGLSVVDSSATVTLSGEVAIEFDYERQVTAGNGLTGTGALAVQPHGTTLSVSASGVKLRDGAAAGQELFWDGTAWYLVGRKTGAALADANATLQYTTAPQYAWPVAVNTTAIRTLTLGTTGLAALPLAGDGSIQTVRFLRSLSHDVVINNGGPGGAGSFKGTITIPAGFGPCDVSFYFDGTNWAFAGIAALGTVTAA